MENEVTALKLYNSNVKSVGTLKVQIVPTDSSYEREPELAPEDPKEILKQAIHFKINIIQANDLPKGYGNFFCSYKLPYPTTNFATEKVTEGHGNPVWNFSQKHSYDFVTETLLNFLLESSISVKVYGHSEAVKKLAAAPKKVEAKELPKKEEENVERKKETTKPQKEDDKLTAVTIAPAKSSIFI